MAILFEERVLSDSINISAPSDKVWDFFDNLDVNYTAWHPDDHIVCRWIRGEPHQVGSIVYAEEMLAGKLCKIKMVCVKIEKNKLSEYRSSFPLSVFHPRSKYIFEQKGQDTLFTAVNYFRIPKLFFKRTIELLVDATEKHVREEGQRLKSLLEGGT